MKYAIGWQLLDTGEMYEGPTLKGWTKKEALALCSYANKHYIRALHVLIEKEVN